MTLYSSLAALCLLMLAAAVEARLLDPGRVWTKLTQSKIIKDNAVRHMSMDDVDMLASPFLLRGRPLPMQIPKSSLGGPFQWKSCGAADQLIDIHNLTITPSPLSFPGQLNFGFDIVFHDTISSDSQVKAVLKLQVNTGGGWIDIPCIGQIGSCTYDDLCSILKKIQCPADLTQQGIPCNCPFNKGEYKLQKYSVTINAAVLPAGDYQAQATLSDATNKQIACYQIFFTVV